MNEDFFEDQEAEHYASQPDSIADIDRYDAELGALNRNDTTSEWILSDRDCWYRNPFFTGTPSGTHPEDEHDLYPAPEGYVPPVFPEPEVTDPEDDCPF